MPRSARLALLSVGLCLVLLPIGIVRPGWPPTLKADEPAYLGLALSLALDGDVRCDFSDVRRLTDLYPYLPINNLILMSDDGWQTVYYGKPYVFPLLAAPAVRWFGGHGMVAFNLALLVAMIWMGAVYLGRFNRWPLALLFSAGFFVLGSAFAYVFWLQPEIFNMCAVTACLFLAFHRPPEGRRSAAAWFWLVRAAGSGAVLTLGVYNKPVLAAMGLPALYIFYRRHDLRTALAWLAAAAIALGLLAGLGVALSGHPTAYLGAARGGVKLQDPDEPDDYLARLREVAAKRGTDTANSWTWILRIPEIDWRELSENVGYFFWGRHTGLLLYLPFAGLAALLFLLNRPGSGSRWILIGALGIVALFFLIWIPFNWHGGGGFIGNRYYVNVYPGFLFLVTRIRPAAATVIGYAFGGLALGPIVLTPFGAPVPSPTLQAHVRNFPFRHFPLELSIKGNVPGYSSTSLGGVQLLARSDVVNVSKSHPGRLWIQGATDTEVLMQSYQPIESALFEVRSIAPENRIRLEMPGDRVELELGAGHGRAGRVETVELEPRGPSRVRYDGDKPVYVYELRVAPATGRIPRGPDGGYAQPFYFGCSIDYLGRRDQLEGEAHYRVSWHRVSAPDRVAAGAALEVAAVLRNEGESSWPSSGPLPVHVGYRWIGADAQAVDVESRRTALPADVPPGGDAELTIGVDAPDVPGSYVLVLDLVRGRVAWFSRRGGATLELPIEVTAAAAPTVSEPGELGRPGQPGGPGELTDSAEPTEPGSSGEPADRGEP